METRSSKYLSADVSNKPKLTRTNKNRYLYDDVNNKIGYEEIDNFSSYEKLDNTGLIRTREEYQRMRNNVVTDDDVVLEKKEKIVENKVYDINSILEEAKKNRVISDYDEKKRKLQSAEYNILADLNKKYINRKEKIEEELEKEGIRELIDTITSKSLPKDIAKANDEGEDEDVDDGKDLMSDLLATNTMTAIKGINLEEEIAKEILVSNEDKDDLEDEIINEDGKLVNSFYTRSMDLSEQDFELRDEIEEESKEKRKILILVVLIIIVIIVIASIFILKKINII